MFNTDKDKQEWRNLSTLSVEENALIWFLNKAHWDIISQIGFQANTFFMISDKCL